MTGRVVDDETGDPISGVNLMIIDYPETTATSGPDGRFETHGTEFRKMFSMPLGDRMYSYNLEASLSEYKTVRKYFNVFRDETVEIKEIKLEKQNHAAN
ncbi:carboxypeptidase-like regulatory domain-containing protein [Kiritimatiellota bacterium B12222]|nr:carboxypeptidase-like regulatory domain-containing protein [Kiritimatiellota bacterium B12222]